MSELILSLQQKILQLEARLEKYRTCPSYQVYTRQAIEDEWSVIKKTPNLAIAFIDIDNLGAHNEKKGYELVNAQLSASFDVIRNEEYFIGRFFSGDEILILAPKTEIAIPCKRLQRVLYSFKITATIGIAKYQGEDELKDAVLAASQLCLEGKKIKKGIIYGL